MCGKDTQMSHFLSAFSSGTYSISLRGLAMLNGGYHTWTLKGYQGFSSASAAAVDTARNATPPSRAKPGGVAGWFTAFSRFIGRGVACATAPRAHRRATAASPETVAQVPLVVNSDNM